MSAFYNNLKGNIQQLLEKYKQQTISIYDINVEIPKLLSNVLALFESTDLPAVSSDSQRTYPVLINGDKTHCTEAQIKRLRQKAGDEYMLLDMPRQTLTVHTPNCRQTFDFERFPHPVQRILAWGMTRPGEPLNQDNFWSHETLKRYIFSTRHVLEDNKDHYIIKTGKGRTLPSGSYYFSPRLKYTVIKNPESTSNPPLVNKPVLK